MKRLSISVLIVVALIVLGINAFGDKADAHRGSGRKIPSVSVNAKK